MDKSQEPKNPTPSPEQKVEPAPTSQPPVPPVSPTQPSVSWKTIGITVGVVIVGLLVLGIARRGQRQGRLEQWREKQQQQPTIYQPQPTVFYPSPTIVPGEPTSTPTPTTGTPVSYQVTVAEVDWNAGLKNRVAETQNKTYPLASLTVSLYEGSGRVNATWTTGAAYTAELYVDETGKELKLRNPSFTGAGSFDESYRNTATDVFQAEITSAMKGHFSNKLDHLEIHYGKVVFFYHQ